MVAIKIKQILVVGLLLCLSVQNAFAEMMEKGKTKVKTLFNFYNQSSKGGKQVFDNSGNENVTVIEPQIFIKHQINENTEINANFVLDTWTAESDTILDGRTGASGEDEGISGQARFAPNVGVRKEIGKTSMGLNLGFSSEYDYTSKNISFNLDRTFAEDNFALGFSVQKYLDEVKLFNDVSPPAGARLMTHKRNITAYTLGASQILSRSDLVEFGMTYAETSGRLESTAGTVSINGVRELEVLPGLRQRKALFGKWVHALSDEMSLNLSYRNYFDDWGGHADTIRAAYLISMREEQDYIEFALRYHSQKAVDYYKNQFAANEKYMTSDSDMAKFNSIESSVHYSRNMGEKKWFGIEIDESEWTNSLTYGHRNTGMGYAYLQTAFAIKF